MKSEPNRASGTLKRQDSFKIPSILEIRRKFKVPTGKKDREVNPSRLYEKSAISVVRKWVGDRGEVFDTSSGNGPDFEIKYRNGRTGIGEIGSHIDPKIAAAWSSVRKRRKHQIIDLPVGYGVWVLSLEYGANIDRLYSQLPSFISQLIEAGVHELDFFSNWLEGPLAVSGAQLAIEQIYFKDDRDGNYAFFFLRGDGGSVPSDGDLIVPWIESLLGGEEFGDLWQKLHKHENMTGNIYEEKHVYLISESLTDFGIGQLLKNIESNLPSRAPILPEGITHVWAQSEVSGSRSILWSIDLSWIIV